MHYSEFLNFCQMENKGDSLPPLLQALFEIKKNNWTAAHEIAQEDKTQNGSWLHAHVHRVEGDLGNAHYWYRLAKREPCTLPLEEEWQHLAQSFCQIEIV